MHARVWVLAAGTVCSACTQDTATQVIVQLYVDAELATTATHFEVTSENEEGEIVFEHDEELAGAPGRIARIPVIPKGDDPSRRFRVLAELSGGAGVLGRIEARAGYHEHELRSLNLYFTSACKDQLDCGPGRTCDHGICRGACFETSASDSIEPSEPSCKECERCSSRCEPADGASCGCPGETCSGGACQPNTRLRFVAAGWHHTCAVANTPAGEVYCWGTTDGFGAGWSSASPVATGALGTYGVAVTNHGCALTPQTRTCWGANDDGELGAPGDTSPIEVANASPELRTIDTGFNHTCARSQSGDVLCWGDNSKGQLGIGSITPKGEATSVPALVGSGYQQIATDGDHSCALESGGALRCWGKNEAGQIGVGDRGSITLPSEPGCEDASSPTCFRDWTAVGVGGWVTCAIRASGALYCWGSNVYGERGTGSPDDEDVSVPSAVGAGTQWMKVDGGFRHTCALDASDQLHCWGLNTDHQVSPVTEGSVGAPRRIDAYAPAGWRSVALGRYHTCAIREDETLWCWGGNAELQIGVPGAGARVDHPTRVCF